MELKVKEYAALLFENMLNTNNTGLEHWESIRAEAEPLVRQLVALNSKMKGGGYQLYGFKVDDKPVLARHQRVSEAQRRTLGVQAGTLKPGDRCWVGEMSIGFDYPATVLTIEKDTVAIEVEEDRLYRAHKTETVYKAPDDFEDEWDVEDDYWVKIADKLGI